ncbi:MAG: Asp-tRNA(Asn)/Glu-tRNA(Gln) amidotransferase subunit GatA, partial [Nocardiopsis sp. BM-2018]
MGELTRLGLAEAKRRVAARELTAVELAQAHLDAMAEARGLNAFITETPELALRMAAESDQRVAKGEAGLLEGLPIAIKDLFCTENVLTTAGSHILDGFTPPYESTVTRNLWAQGAVSLGKTNLDEFAMGSSNTTSYHGPVRNPWTRPEDNAALVPGGSSGGSAAAVAARIALAATGTDTGGSIRQPAAFCGISGIKPTYGRCSRFGIVAFASSLDQAGAFGRDVADTALLLQAMAGYDPKDSTSADLPVPDWTGALSGKVKGKRIGIPAEYRVDGMPAAIEKLWQAGADWLAAEGAEIVEISLPHTKYALPTYYIIAPAEASSNLARYDGMRYGLRVAGADLKETYEKTRAAGFGAEVKRRIMIGTYVLSAGYYDAYYLKAQKVRRRIVDDFQAAFEQVDAILTPTAPSAAFRVGEKMDDPVAMYLNDVFTVPSSLAGLPAMSVPAGLSAEGLPLGLQVIGRAW